MARQTSKGFTIIEVLIVLSIAALILLAVFLAVPTLSRVKRNTSRQRDAEFIIAQRLDYNTENHTVISEGGFNCDDPLTGKLFCNYLVNGLIYYELRNVTFHNSGTMPPATVPTVTDLDLIRTDTFLKCNDTGTGAEIAQDSRSMVVLFAVETSSGILSKCLESSVIPT